MSLTDAVFSPKWEDMRRPDWIHPLTWLYLEKCGFEIKMIADNSAFFELPLRFACGTFVVRGLDLWRPDKDVWPQGAMTLWRDMTSDSEDSWSWNSLRQVKANLARCGIKPKIMMKEAIKRK